MTRVAREVGTEGKLGGQAQVPGVAGTWKDLTDTVNVMAANLTEQVRGIVKVVTAVANGDLKQNLTVASKGEVAALAETINNMTDTLATFADQVTTVAREVGVEGRLGGQANVPGAAGTWKDLTGNVNLLAANLTTQVRAIAEVATAVTKGDLTRSIQVEARGEVAELKDNINTMIDNLRLTTDRNTEQDWLKTNLARFTSMLQGQRDLATVGRMLLSELAPLVDAQQGVIYQVEPEAHAESASCSPPMPTTASAGHPEHLRIGAGPDRPVRRRRPAHADHRACRPTWCRSAPACSRRRPRNVIVLPVLFEGQVKAVIELASLGSFTDLQLAFLEQLTAGIGIVLNTIEATMQTEGLLKQSQQLAGELQTQQSELQQTNEQLEQKAQQLAEQNVEVERKNQEIEQARRALEEKATELALTSKYKSEFLANMSHELRTPLNSILILGQQLGDNPDGNLTPQQVEFARTIHGAGTDLLNLISDILDLSKIESGTVSVDAEEILLHQPAGDGDAAVPPRGGKPRPVVRRAGRSAACASIITDSKRLQQVLKNLLSNAFKFTEHGGVQFVFARSRFSSSSSTSFARARRSRISCSSAARKPRSCRRRSGPDGSASSSCLNCATCSVTCARSASAARTWTANPDRRAPGPSCRRSSPLPVSPSLPRSARSGSGSAAGPVPLRCRGGTPTACRGSPERRRTASDTPHDARTDVRSPAPRRSLPASHTAIPPAVPPDRSPDAPPCRRAL